MCAIEHLRYQDETDCSSSKALWLLEFVSHLSTGPFNTKIIPTAFNVQIILGTKNANLLTEAPTLPRTVTVITGKAQETSSRK